MRNIQYLFVRGQINNVIHCKNVLLPPLVTYFAQPLHYFFAFSYKNCLGEQIYNVSDESSYYQMPLFYMLILAKK